MNLHDFLQKCCAKFGDRYDYSNIINIINNKAKLHIICRVHGSFYQSANSHLRAKHGCRKCDIEARASNRTTTINEFILRASLRHNYKYDYSLVSFNNLNDTVLIICPAHGVFSTAAIVHLNSECRECSNDKYRKKNDDVIEEANIIHNNEYDYSQMGIYKNNKTKVKIICNSHGPFFMKMDQHICKRKKCPKCVELLKIKERTDNFKERANIIHNNIYDYSLVYEYSSLSTKKIQIICGEHGVFLQIGWQHLAGSKCPKCVKYNRKLTLDNFLIQAQAAHGDKYDYSEVNVNYVFNKIKIICYKHGPFLQRVNSHLYTKCGCPFCSKIVSKSETEWLNYLNIPIEYRNKSIIIGDKRFFPDGFDPITNTLYEFYGDYWHGNLNIYKPDQINKLNKMTFLYLYNRTLKREKIIKDNGYKIVSIWEADWLKISKTLIDKPMEEHQDTGYFKDIDDISDEIEKLEI